MKLTHAQERALRMIFDGDPAKTFYTDCLGTDGKGRNPTFRCLRKLGLIEHTQIAGNSWRTRLTAQGVHYLHGETE